MNVAALDQLDHAAFCAAFDGLLEHCPWAVDEVARRRPHATLERLLAAFSDAIRAAPLEARLQALRDHPRLAAGVAPSEHSAREQAGAGLNALTVEEKQRFDELNTRYLQRFGFPFIVAVTGLDKHTILALMAARVEGEAEAELAEAVEQLIRIVQLRVRRTLSG